MPNNPTEVTRAAMSGHIPALAGVRSSATRKSPITTPEATAMGTAVIDRDRTSTRVIGSPVGEGACPTSTIAVAASTIPAPVSIESASPDAMPTATGTMTAQTAVTGATTLIGPIARPR